MASILGIDTIQTLGGTTAATIANGGRILQPEKPHFHVSKTDGHVGASTTIVWNNVVRDTESAYNTSTGKYTIPSGLTGLWWFGASVLSQSTAYTEITLDVDGVGTFNGRNASPNAVNSCAQISAAYYATAGDEILIKTEASSSAYGTGSRFSFWTGYFIG